MDFPAVIPLPAIRLPPAAVFPSRWSDGNMFAWHGASEQIGEAGDILADQVLRHFDCPAEELLARMRAGEPPPEELRQAVYLEWYSDQNGRVVIQDTRLGVERLGARSFELTEDDLRLENEEAERRLEELRGHGYIIEETPLGVLLYHEDDAEGSWGDSLQDELDREAARIERAIQGSLDDLPENDDTPE